MELNDLGVSKALKDKIAASGIEFSVIRTMSVKQLMGIRGIGYGSANKILRALATVADGVKCSLYLVHEERPDRRDLVGYFVHEDDAFLIGDLLIALDKNTDLPEREYTGFEVFEISD